MRLKVFTLNMWYGKYIDQILSFAQDQDSDVMLFQEISSGLEGETEYGITNAYEQLKDRFNQYHSSFTPCWRYAGASNRFSLGLAIFSKHPIAATQTRYYHKDVVTLGDKPLAGAENFPGVYHQASLDLGGRQIDVASTHFIWSLHPEINDHQRAAVEKLTQILESKNNLILGGDFNVTDDSEIYQRLTQHLVDDRPEGLESTLHPEIHKVGHEKKLAVDYLFHKGEGINLVSSHVPVVPISDHLPVVGEYEV